LPDEFSFIATCGFSYDSSYRTTNISAKHAPFRVSQYITFVPALEHSHEFSNITACFATFSTACQCADITTNLTAFRISFLSANISTIVIAYLPSNFTANHTAKLSANCNTKRVTFSNSIFRTV
jgi:hypothetical protein